MTERKIDIDPTVAQSIPESLLKDYGIIRDEHGNLHATKATGALLAINRFNRSYMQRLPAAPRYLYADAQGQGVTRTAWWRGEGYSNRILRQYATKSPLALSVSSACTAGIRAATKLRIGSDRSPGIKIVHKDWTRSRRTPEGFERVIEYIEEILQVPFMGDSRSPACLSLDALCAGVYSDIFTLNMGVIEPIYDARGYIKGFRPGDGGIIVPSWAIVSQWAQDHKDARVLETINKETNEELQREALSEHLGVDLVTAEWVVYRDGIVDGVYQPGRLIVHPMQTSTDINYFGFPPGYLQLMMEIIAHEFVIHDYHGRKFTDSSWLDMLLAITGEGYDEAAVDQALTDLSMNAMGYKKAKKPATVHLGADGDVKTIQLSPPATDMEFTKQLEYYKALACAIVRRNPELINSAIPRASGPSLSDGSQDYLAELARSDGHVADVEHICGMVSQAVRKIHPDARAIVVHAGKRQDAEIDIGLKLTQHLLSRNDVLNTMTDQEPVGFWLPRDQLAEASEEELRKYWGNPYNYPSDSAFTAQVKMALPLIGITPPGEGDEASPPEEAPDDDEEMTKGLEDPSPCPGWDEY